MAKDFLIGLDIGGTKCAVVLAKNQNGIVFIDKISFPTESQKAFEYTYNKLLESIKDILHKNELCQRDIASIGISCGGPLDSKKGVIMSPPNLPGWDNIHIVDMLEKEFGIYTFLQNDANACALAEWKLGAGKGCCNMIFLTMGTGMGAGLIIDGKLYTGKNDMAGEVGHIRLQEDGPEGYGKAGSFEGFCSGGGISRLSRMKAEKWLKDGHKLSWCNDKNGLEDIDTKKLAEAAKSGDKYAKLIFDEVGKKLGQALSVLIDTLNPEMIVIGSVFARCEDLLRQAMEEEIQNEAINISRMACRIVPAFLGESIGDYASIITAAYGSGIEIDNGIPHRVMKHLQRLMERYPLLKGTEEDIITAFRFISGAFSKGSKLLVCGNGGSASDSEHIVGELMKGFYKKRPLTDDQCKEIIKGSGHKGKYIAMNLQGSLPAIALTQHSALSTAFLNDVAPDMVFAQQAYGYGIKGDVLLGISTSGNSLNVVNAVMAAKAKGLKTVGLTGENGGVMNEICDVVIKVPGKITADIQELHLPVYHALCAMLEDMFFEMD